MNRFAAAAQKCDKSSSLNIINYCTFLKSGSRFSSQQWRVHDDMLKDTRWSTKKAKVLPSELVTGGL